jgi:hypothetical protein
VLGSGDDRSQGSGQFFLTNPQTGQQTWVGADGSTLLGQLFAKDFAGWTKGQSDLYTNFLATAPPGTPLPQGMEYAAPAYQQMSANNVPQRIKTFYDQLGGQQGVGMAYPDFLASVARLGIAVTGNKWG